MKAMVLTKISKVEDSPLEIMNLPVPEPDSKQILVKVSACGICHTDIDEVEGRLMPKLPVVLGHQIVGRVERKGKKVKRFGIGDRVGIGWIYSACGRCRFCLNGYENLCENFRATGKDANGGYAECTVVDERFVYPVPERFTDSQAAPLLCAGAIGYRALRLTGMREGSGVLGLFGFGASAHIVIQVVKHLYPDSRVFVFTRPGQKEHQHLARRLGADWVGATGEDPPEKLNYAIDFTPAWNPIIEALKVLDRKGVLVINAIRKEDGDKETMLKIDYRDLWLEKEIRSVANVTRKDLEEFLPLAAETPIVPEIQEFRLEEANHALILLKQGRIRGAGVLRIEHTKI